MNSNIKPRLNKLLSGYGFTLYHKPAGRDAVRGEYWAFKVRHPVDPKLEDVMCYIERWDSMHLRLGDEVTTYKRRYFTNMLTRISRLTATHDAHAGVQ